MIHMCTIEDESKRLIDEKGQTVLFEGKTYHGIHRHSSFIKEKFGYKTEYVCLSNKAVLENGTQIEILWPDNTLSVHTVTITQTSDAFFDRDADCTFHTKYNWPKILINHRGRAASINLHDLNKARTVRTWASRSREKELADWELDNEQRLRARILLAKARKLEGYTQEMSEAYKESTSSLSKVEQLSRVQMEYETSIAPFLRYSDNEEDRENVEVDEMHPVQCPVCANQFTFWDFQDEVTYRVKRRSEATNLDIYDDYKICPECSSHKFWCGKFSRDPKQEVEIHG